MVGDRLPQFMRAGARRYGSCPSMAAFAASRTPSARRSPGTLARLIDPVSTAKSVSSPRRSGAEALQLGGEVGRRRGHRWALYAATQRGPWWRAKPCGQPYVAPMPPRRLRCAVCRGCTPTVGRRRRACQRPRRRVRQVEPTTPMHRPRSTMRSRGERHMRYSRRCPPSAPRCSTASCTSDHADREGSCPAGPTIVASQYETLSTQPTDAEVASPVAMPSGPRRGHPPPGAPRIVGASARDRALRRRDPRHQRRHAARVRPGRFDVHASSTTACTSWSSRSLRPRSPERLRADREHRATVASIGRLLRPSSIASRDRRLAVPSPSNLGSDLAARRANLLPRFETSGVSPAASSQPRDCPGHDVVVLDLPAVEIADAGWRWADAGAGCSSSCRAQHRTPKAAVRS